MTFINIKECISLICLCVIVKKASSEYVTKDIVINGLKHQILGASRIINNVPVEYYARIPFAAPPIGALRFKHPQELRGQVWTGVYNATLQPNTCWQADGGDFDKLNPAARMWLSKTTMSEDCLYLSIWVPKLSSTNIPVMVWIYGGSFLSGSSTLEVYDGSILAAKQGVIVVSLQYRLGPLGFMYLDEVLAPGNQGLMDQRMALTWVKSNINNFNGDNSAITIFGESAGSASVSLQILSPLTEKLFSRAIMESGTGLSPWAVETTEESRAKAFELAKYVNCSQALENMSKLLDCFNSVDPSTLVNLQFSLKDMSTKERVALLKKRGLLNLVTDGSYFVEFYFRPIVDGYFLPKSVPALLASWNSSRRVDLLMGFNANEGMYFLLYGLNQWLNFLVKGEVVQTDLLSSSNPKSIKASAFVLENLLNKKYLYKSLVPLLMYEYKVPSVSLGYKQWESVQVISALDQMTGDELFVCPVISYAESMSERNQNVYMYNFRHKTANATLPDWVGTMHGYEIEYVFGMPYLPEFTQNFYNFTVDEQRLSDSVMTMWTNFVKYGNPTPEPIKYFNQTVTWMPYNTSMPEVFHFSLSKEIPFRTNAKSKQCKFWTKVIPALMTEINKVSKRSIMVTQTWGMVMGSLIILSSRLW